MKSPTPKLGNIVRDRTTGFQGVASTITELLNGTVQFAVQPKCDKKEPGKFPDAFNIDVQMLEYVDEGTASLVMPAPAVHVRLGDKVKDSVSGITGIATAKHTYQNGCVYFYVQREHDGKADKAPEQIHVSFERLEIVQAGAFKPAGAPASTSLPPRRTGGPTTRATRMS